jgi:DNA-binding transcriptional regulator YiaG
LTLKQTRERLGLSQSQLAEALGVTTQTISNWETGQRIPPPFLDRALRDVARELKLNPKAKK